MSRIPYEQKVIGAPFSLVIRCSDNAALKYGKLEQPAELAAIPPFRRGTQYLFESN